MGKQMHMTWRQLLEVLSQMPSEHLDDDVTICVNGEFFPVKSMGLVDEEDEEGGGVLDDGHSYLSAD